MKDSRVEEALIRLRPLAPPERLRVAAGPWDAIAVLLLAEPPMSVEAKYIASVAHLPRQEPFLALTGVAEERGREAEDLLKRVLPGVFEAELRSCGDRCVLVNQGPCPCRVPATVAALRRRQRALLWAAEAIMRPQENRLATRK